jgi:RNase P subunit RPR2
VIPQTEYDSRYPHLTPSAIAPSGLLVNVTCEKCGHRNRLERRRTAAEVFHLVCHGCEAILRTEYVPT